MNNFDLTVFKLIAREIEIPKFEKWVYEERKLEGILTPDEYLELISQAYKQPSSLYEAERILKRYINIGNYHEWYLRRILQKIIGRSVDAHKYIEQCYDLYCKGYGFLDNLGLGYGLAIIVPPSNYNGGSWDKLESPEQIKLLDSFYPDVRREAEKVLGWLDSGEISITGHDGSSQGIEYMDIRKKEDKEPTGYKIASPSKKWWKLW